MQVSSEISPRFVNKDLWNAHMTDSSLHVKIRIYQETGDQRIGCLLAELMIGTQEIRKRLVASIDSFCFCFCFCFCSIIAPKTCYIVTNVNHGVPNLVDPSTNAVF